MRTYLRILQGLEERRHANKAYIIVPDNEVLFFFARQPERVLEHCSLIRVGSPRSDNDANLQTPHGQSSP